MREAPWRRLMRPALTNERLRLAPGTLPEDVSASGRGPAGAMFRMPDPRTASGGTGSRTPAERPRGIPVAATALAVGDSLSTPLPGRVRARLLGWLENFGEAAASPYDGDLLAAAHPAGRDIPAGIAAIVVTSTE